MNVKVDKVGACRLQVSVSVPADEVRPAYERVVKQFAGKARIPGFRPGKAPTALVETRFRKEIAKETQDQLLPDTYQEMIKKESLRPVAIVALDNANLSPDNGFSFQVTLDVVPEFKLPKYQKIPVAAVNADVGEKDVDEALASMRKRMARYEDLEGGTVQDQDMVKVTYSGTCDGRPLTEVDASAGELADGTDFWIPIVTESEFLPGLNAALTGTASGGTVKVDVEFPADYRVKGLAGRNAVYDFTVKALRRMREPALDDAFLKDVGMATADDLRKRIREDLEAAKKESEDSRQRREISTFLLEHTKLEVPESQVAGETQSLLRSLLSRMARAGGTREMLEKHRDEIMGSVAQQASERVRLSYILQEIAGAETITLTDEDVNAEIGRLAGQYGMPEAKLRAEIEKQEGGMAHLRHDLLQTRVLDYLLGQAKVK